MDMYNFGKVEFFRFLYAYLSKTIGEIKRYTVSDNCKKNSMHPYFLFDPFLLIEA